MRHRAQGRLPYGAEHERQGVAHRAHPVTSARSRCSEGITWTEWTDDRRFRRTRRLLSKTDERRCRSHTASLRMSGQQSVSPSRSWTICRGGAGGRMVADSPLRVPANSAYRSAQQNRSPLLIRPLARCCSPWLKMSWNAAPPFHSTSGWKVVALSPQEDQKIGKVTPRLGSVVTAPLASAGAPSIAEL